ncbi:MAG: hydroxymethylglutaryl-CoA reductase [Gemmatimonadaceae bacterium]|nr:hydroxymethylglutaryl-CoA reductase [Gemmatimonadaceae bacterium]
MKIPSLLLRQLYTFGSLTETEGGVRLSLKNRLSDATLTGLWRLRIGGVEIPMTHVDFDLGDGQRRPAAGLTDLAPAAFPLRQVAVLHVRDVRLPQGTHDIIVGFDAKPFGKLEVKVKDALGRETPTQPRLPRGQGEPGADYTREMATERRTFVERATGGTLEHVGHYSFEPARLQGNIESFIGVAQVPIGVAGPLRINGEHAQGDFFIPMATTEGTLVASYNRGMKVLNLSGGVTTTVSDDRMQRAPVFIFDSAREARDFKRWVDEHLEEIRREAEATSSVAKLLEIDFYFANKFAFLRFNYATGDAAGQNMVGRATFAACSWILEHNPTIRKFFLESNLATDKKASQVNVMRTRGKRVTAEATIPKQVLQEHMRVDPATLAHHAGVANVGAFLSGANNNGLHSPNGITALFIATGQDVANVSESSAGIVYVDLTAEGDLYLSITIPSLIVATHGGGTGLATQRECLGMLGCVGRGTVHKFAEIVAGVVLAGELSLASAISSYDWVSSHERYGRNR